MIRWFCVMKERDHENYVMPSLAKGYAQVMADAAAALERYSVPQRWYPVPLVDPNSVPDTEEELHELVMTVPLFAAIFKAGRNVEVMNQRERERAYAENPER